MNHDVFQGMPCIKKCVQFSDYPSIANYETDGELWPYTASSRRFAQELPANYIPKFDERAVSDATLVGAMHESMVKDMLNGTKTSCKFQCDSDFGCDSCIPAGLSAEPEKPDISPKKGNAAVALSTTGFFPHSMDCGYGRCSGFAVENGRGDGEYLRIVPTAEVFHRQWEYFRY